MIPKEELAQHVKEALGHFYDPSFLHASPLAELLGEQPSAKATAVALRGLLRQTIETLRPPESVPFGQPAWLNYRVLWLHYIQTRGANAVCNELALSRATFYRQLQRGVEAVAEVLWSNHLRTRRSQQDARDASFADPDAHALQEAVKLARQSARQSIDLNEVARKVKHMLKPLLAQRGLDFVTHLPPLPVYARADPAMLRQVFVNLITAICKQDLRGPLQLRLAVEGAQAMARLSAYADPAAVLDAATLERIPEFTLAQDVLEVYGGRSWLRLVHDDDPHLEFSWTIPLVGAQTILIVDDDEDVVRVYERYLGADFSLQVASDASQLRDALRESHPALIILDVLMPQEDGWVILQRLKTLPETADIPVLIYSVLSQPSLALSLGATEVLRKPIDEKQLLSAVRRILDQDSAA